MTTVHHPPGSDPLSPPGTTPYFRRLAAIDAAAGEEKARRARVAAFSAAVREELARRGWLAIAAAAGEELARRARLP
jgi:hypothetical protein